jgi:hypothetical protein
VGPLAFVCGASEGWRIQAFDDVGGGDVVAVVVLDQDLRLKENRDVEAVCAADAVWAEEPDPVLRTRVLW